MLRPIVPALAVLVAALISSPAPAQESASDLADYAFELFKEGFTHYKTNRRDPVAREFFEESGRLYAQASRKGKNPKFREVHAANSVLLKRWAVLANCMERIDSTDVEQLRDLIGQNRRAPTPPYHESCLAFPDYPQFALESRIRARIERLTTGAPAGPDAPEIMIDSAKR